MRTARIGAMLLAAIVVITACSDDEESSPSTAPATTQDASTSTSSPESSTTVNTDAADTTDASDATALDEPAASQYYLAIGDSYAVGYLAGIGPSTDGFVDGVVAGAADAGRPLQVINVGCSGATTASLIGTPGCEPAALAPGADPYSTTQLDAAVAFLEAHPGEVALITVSIGGNDVIPCAITGPDLVACVTTATTTMAANLTTALDRIRAAAPDALVVGTTYPDVALGAWVTTFPGAKERAAESVTAFRDVINPALLDAYTAAGGRFVDVTEATGGYGSLDDTTTLDPYGEVPTPVAQVCELTAFCSDFDIHPTPDGYDLIAGLVLAEYLG